MQYRNLGRSGLRVSVVGLGTNNFGGRADRQASVRVLQRALDEGVNFVDTANMYTRGQSEAIIGEALQGHRDDVVLATKAGMAVGEGPLGHGASRLHLLRELEGSLRRLQTDHVDLFWVHIHDPETPAEETARALDDMVRAGKVRYVGASNYAAWQLAQALGAADRQGCVPFIGLQNEYSLHQRSAEREAIGACQALGVGFVAYYPLGGGALTGKYRPGEPPPPGSRATKTPNMAGRFLSAPRLAAVAEIERVASQVGCTTAQLSLAWLLHRPGVAAVIPGATRPEQVDENLGAADLRLDDDVVRRLDEATASFV